MHALFAFLLRVNNVCRGKHTDHVTRRAAAPEEEERPCITHNTHTHHILRGRRRRNNSEDDDDDDDELSSCPHSTNYFPAAGKTILEIGDPARNVIEMIFRATTDVTRCSINIKQVLKLNNSRETLERFEKLREEMKNRAYMHCNKHPRNIVDGNEQLLFYGTKLTCCKQFRTSKLCTDTNCSICNIIKSGFYNAKRKTGTWLTASCQDIINANANADVMNGKMAIVVCRVISGRVVDMTDSYNGGDYDSLVGVKPNHLFVKNSSAVLPCFVIILNRM